MAQFFFHTEDGRSVSDDEGTDLETLADARVEAVRVLGDILRESPEEVLATGQLRLTVTDPAKLPSHPQKIFFSLWGSDTLGEWMGAFADPGRKVTLQVDRLAFTALGDKCQFPESVACKLQ